MAGRARLGKGGRSYPPTEYRLPERSAPLLSEPRRCTRIRQPLSKGGKTDWKNETQSPLHGRYCDNLQRAGGVELALAVLARHAGAPSVFRPTYEVQPAPAASARPRGAEATSSVLAARLLSREAGPSLRRAGAGAQVLVRLHREALTAEVLGEFPGARRWVAQARRPRPRPRPAPAPRAIKLEWRQPLQMANVATRRAPLRAAAAAVPARAAR